MELEEVAMFVEAVFELVHEQMSSVFLRNAYEDLITLFIWTRVN